MLFLKFVYLALTATIVSGKGKAAKGLSKLAAMTAKEVVGKDEYKRLAQEVSKSSEYKDYMQQIAANVAETPYTLLESVRASAPAVLEAAVAVGVSEALSVADDAVTNLRTPVALKTGGVDALVDDAGGIVCDLNNQRQILEFIASTLTTLAELSAALKVAKNDYDAGNYADAIVLLDTTISPVLSQLTNLALTKIPHSGTVGQWRDALVKLNNLVLQYIQAPHGPDSWVGFKNQVTALLDELLGFPQLLNSQLGSKKHAPGPNMSKRELQAMAIHEGISVGCTCGWNLFHLISTRKDEAVTTTTTSSPQAVPSGPFTVDDTLKQTVALILFIENTTSSLRYLIKEIRECKKDKASWENLEYRILIQILQLIDEAAQNREFQRVYRVLKANSHNLSHYLITIAEGTSVEQMEGAVVNFIEDLQVQLNHACPAV